MNSLRTATTDDASAIAKVQVDSWRSAYRGLVSDDVLDSLSYETQASRWNDILQRPDQHTFVVEEKSGTVIGFANGGPERRGDLGFAGELYAIYILDEYHGKGMGRMLFSHFASALLDSDVTDMMVWVLKDSPYRAFYEVLGGKHYHSDKIEIGTQTFTEYAYGWKDLKSITAQ